MDNQLFRKKSMDRISSPERLQDYMRVTTPGIWMVLGAIILLLGGLLVSSVVGKLETTVSVEAEVKDGVVTVALPVSQGKDLKPGMTVRIADKETEIDYIYESSSGETISTAHLSLADGSYAGEIVTESVSPISFLVN